MINPSILRGLGWMFIYMGIFTINDIIIVEYIRKNTKMNIILYYLPVILIGSGIVMWAHNSKKNTCINSEDDTDLN